MGKLCIISQHENAISETFIQAHIELLEGAKVVLNGNYPDYVCSHRQIRFFYGSKRPLKKLAKLLPHYFYERWITPHALSQKSLHDYLSGFFKAHHADVILAEYRLQRGGDLPSCSRAGHPLDCSFSWS